METTSSTLLLRTPERKVIVTLFLPLFRIYIKLQGEDDELFYKTHHIGVHPIFIRDGETPKFVLEKVQNTIIKIMQKKQAAFEKRKKK